jgi:hypothetical protein
VALVGAAALWQVSKKWSARICVNTAVGVALLNLFLAVALVPSLENSLGANQILKPLGTALRREYQPGDVVVCWRRLPQGLIFYGSPAISVTNRPCLGAMSPQSVPFEFPGNRDRFGRLILADETALENLLAGRNRVLVVNYQANPQLARSWAQTLRLRSVEEVGRWQLYSSR